MEFVIIALCITFVIGVIFTYISVKDKERLMSRPKRIEEEIW